MIIFGKAIHRKYNKYIVVICFVILSFLLLSCSKIEFDPTTTSLKYKIDTKTVGEAEHKARTDPEYKEIIKSYAHAEANLIKAKLMYRCSKTLSIYWTHPSH